MPKAFCQAAALDSVSVSRGCAGTCRSRPCLRLHLRLAGWRRRQLSGLQEQAQGVTTRGCRAARSLGGACGGRPCLALERRALRRTGGGHAWVAGAPVL